MANHDVVTAMDGIPCMTDDTLSNAQSVSSCGHVSLKVLFRLSIAEAASHEATSTEDKHKAAGKEEDKDKTKKGKGVVILQPCTCPCCMCDEDELRNSIREMRLTNLDELRRSGLLGSTISENEEEEELLTRSFEMALEMEEEWFSSPSGKRAVQGRKKAEESGQIFRSVFLRKGVRAGERIKAAQYTRHMARFENIAENIDRRRNKRPTTAPYQRPSFVYDRADYVSDDEMAAFLLMTTTYNNELAQDLGIEENLLRQLQSLQVRLSLSICVYVIGPG